MPLPILSFKELIAYTDVVMQFSLGYSDHFLEDPDFAPSAHDINVAVALTSSLTKQMTWIIWIVKNTPKSLIMRLSPQLASIRKLEEVSVYCAKYRQEF